MASVKAVPSSVVGPELRADPWADCCSNARWAEAFRLQAISSGNVGAVESAHAAAPSTARRDKQSFFIEAPSKRSQAFSLGGEETTFAEGRNYLDNNDVRRGMTSGVSSGP